MPYRSFCTALALVLLSTQIIACENADCTGAVNLAPAECSGIGCVHSTTNALQHLAQTAKRRFSEMRLPETQMPGLCSLGPCPTEPVATALPEQCGSAGCANREPKTKPAPASALDGVSMDVSTLVTDAFASVAVQAMRVTQQIFWAGWTQRRGYGASYKPASTD